MEKKNDTLVSNERRGVGRKGWGGEREFVRVESQGAAQPKCPQEVGQSPSPWSLQDATRASSRRGLRLPLPISTSPGGTGREAEPLWLPKGWPTA